MELSELKEAKERLVWINGQIVIWEKEVEAGQRALANLLKRKEELEKDVAALNKKILTVE